MPVQERASQDILLEQLAQRVAALAAEQKAKESAIKELNTQIKLAEAEATVKIQDARASVEAECAALALRVAPLKDQLHTCEQLRGEIAVLQRQKAEAVTAVKTARAGEIKDANEAVAAAARRLDQIHQSIDHCKSSVATV